MMILQMEVVRGRVVTITMDSNVHAAKIIQLPFNLVILKKGFEVPEDLPNMLLNL